MPDAITVLEERVVTVRAFGADLVVPLTARAVAAAEQAEAANDDAQDAAITAQAAAATAPLVYANTGAGLAAVAEGGTFWVAGAGGLSLYRDVSGVATLIDSLPLASTVLAGRSYGDDTARDIPISLNGSVLSSPGPVVFVGKDNSTSNAAQYYGIAFPPGVGFGRLKGTYASPTGVVPGDQIGFHDYYGYSDGEMKLVASFDAIVSTSIGFVDGDIPPSNFRWAVSDGAVCRPVMELKGEGRIEIGAIDGEDYYGPGTLGKPGFFVNGLSNDYTAIIAARPASGAGYALRLHTLGATNSDFPLYVSAGVGTGSTVAAFTGAGRMAIGGFVPVCTLDVSGPIRCGQYTVATVPSAAAGAGQQIYVSDETGGAVLAFSDATDWRRITDRTIIS